MALLYAGRQSVDQNDNVRCQTSQYHKLHSTGRYSGYGLNAGGARKRRAVKLTGETQVFEEGSMGEAPGGGSLSTYKELCALATDMGQPDLVYRFMDLANHHASINSSRGAAFG